MRIACMFFVALLPLVAQEYTLKALSRHPLTNESIIALANAGFDESFIVERIQTSRTSFGSNVDDLVALKKAGISEDLIRAMMAPMPSSPPPSHSTVPAPVAVIPVASAPEPSKLVESKWWNYPWVKVHGLICR